MATSIDIYYQYDSRDHKPIISYHNYKFYWKPIVEHHGLQWVELAHTGMLDLVVHLQTKELDEIEHEFLYLQGEIEANDSIEPNIKVMLIRDIEKIISIINQLRREPERFVKIIIG